MLMDKQADGIELLNEGRRLFPSSAIGYAISGIFEISTSMVTEAINSFIRALSLDPTNLIASSGLGFCYAVSSQEKKAIEMIQNLEAHAESVSVASSIAIIYAGLNDSDKFFSWMYRAIDERGMNAFYVVANPLLTGMKRDPRFKQMLEKMNLRPTAGIG